MDCSLLLDSVFGIPIACHTHVRRTTAADFRRNAGFCHTCRRRLEIPDIFVTYKSTLARPERIQRILASNLRGDDTKHGGVKVD